VHHTKPTQNREMRFGGLRVLVIACLLQLGHRAFAEPSLAAEENRDFERMVVLMQAGKESEALLSATDFLRRYPKSERADDAQFVLAEVYFRQRQFHAALQEFAKIPTMKNPGLDKVPDAGLRMGECWLNLGDKQKSQIEWGAVIRKYPKSPAASAARLRLAGIGS
jgi:TolA-binding protein